MELKKTNIYNNSICMKTSTTLPLQISCTKQNHRLSLTPRNVEAHNQSARGGVKNLEIGSYRNTNTDRNSKLPKPISRSFPNSSWQVPQIYTLAHRNAASTPMKYSLKSHRKIYCPRSNNLLSSLPSLHICTSYLPPKLNPNIPTRSKF